MCCDRSHYRSDVCYLRGDARMDPSTSSVFLYTAPRGAGEGAALHAQVRGQHHAHRRRGEHRARGERHRHRNGGGQLASTVRHTAPDGMPTVVFSTGGYTENVYHEFSDGLIPLFVRNST